MITTETLARFARFKRRLRFSTFTAAFAIPHRLRFANVN